MGATLDVEGVEEPPNHGLAQAVEELGCCDLQTD
jgi:hypothetical protein